MANSCLRRLACGTLALLVSAVCFAQERQPIQSVQVITVKPERVGDFEAALKDFQSVLKKAGAERQQTIWTSETGPRVYARVRFYTKFSEIQQLNPKLKDFRDEVERITARIRQCMERSELRISVVDADLSLPRAAEIPDMIRVVHTRLKHGKSEAYRTLLKSEWMPAVRSSGVKSYTFYQVRFGASSNDVYSVAGIKGWADYDQSPSPVVKAMGEEKYRHFLAKIADLVDDREVNIYRLRRDLSYLPERQSTASGGNQ